MMDVELYQWTLVIGIAFVIVEMLTGTFLFLGCAVGALPLVFIHYATDEIVWERDIAVFAIVSAIAFVGLRKYFLKPGDLTEAQEDINKY
jgi:membrane protein implicated in regulation of membrane protease activity